MTSRQSFSRTLEALSLTAFLVAAVFCAPTYAQDQAATAEVSQTLLAQGPLPDAPKPVAASSAQPIVSPAPISPVRSVTETHRFWDTENRMLFAGVVAANAGDFAVTYTNLQNGGRELNPIVRIFGRSAAGLALNFGGQTAGVMGFSYFLHKTGHHRLERLVSMTNIGAGIGAVSYGLAHR